MTEGLRRRGVRVITAHEDRAAEFEDERLLQRATQLGRVLFSQDKDLLILTHQWLQAGIEFSSFTCPFILRVMISYDYDR